MSEDKPQPDFMGMFHDFHARLKTPEISFGEWDDQFGALHNEVLDLDSPISYEPPIAISSGPNVPTARGAGLPSPASRSSIAAATGCQNSRGRTVTRWSCGSHIPRKMRKQKRKADRGVNMCAVRRISG